MRLLAAVAPLSGEGLRITADEDPKITESGKIASHLLVGEHGWLVLRSFHEVLELKREQSLSRIR